MKIEIKKFSRGYAIYAGVSRLSKFFKSEEDAKKDLADNEKMYNYYAGSISTSVDNSSKTIIDAKTGKTKKVEPYLDSQGRIMYEGYKLTEKVLNLFEYSYKNIDIALGTEISTKENDEYHAFINKKYSKEIVNQLQKKLDKINPDFKEVEFSRESYSIAKVLGVNPKKEGIWVYIDMSK